MARALGARSSKGGSSTGGSASGGGKGGSKGGRGGAKAKAAKRSSGLKVTTKNGVRYSRGGKYSLLHAKGNQGKRAWSQIMASQDRRIARIAV